MKEFLQNQVVVYCVMAVLIFSITQGLKWVCVKPWTNKLKNERARKAINSVIFFMPYAVGVALEFLYAVVIMKGEFNAMVGVICGGAGHSVYGLFEMIYNVITGQVKVKKNATTDEEKAIEDFVFSVAEDGKIDENDKSALQAFWDKMRQ